MSAYLRKLIDNKANNLIYSLNNPNIFKEISDKIITKEFNAGELHLIKLERGVKILTRSQYNLYKANEEWNKKKTKYVEQINKLRDELNIKVTFKKPDDIIKLLAKLESIKF